MKNKFDISTFVDVRTEQVVTKDLVDRFKMRRKESRFTQKELSQRSGVSYGSIRRFESTGDISLKSLLRISSAIGCLEDFDEIYNHTIIKELKDL